LTFAAFQRALAAGEVPPVLVFHGDESFLAALGVEMLKRRVLSPGSEAFDFVSLSGRETTAEAIAAHASTAPMLSERRLTVVYEFLGLSPSQRNQLLTYVKSPVDTACVALVNFGPIPGKNKFERELLSAAEVVDCGRAVGEQLDAIVKKLCERREREIDPRALRVLVDWTDGKLSRISNELDKLDCFVPAGETIETEHVEQVVGARASGLRDLASAIAEGDPGRALALLDEIVDGGIDPAQIVSQLYGFWVSLWLSRTGRRGRSRRGSGWAYGRLLPEQGEVSRLASRRTSREYARGIGRFYRADVDIRRGMPPRPTVGLLVYELAEGSS
jgi:DNA polymerase-3 subunit delta